MEQNEQPIIPNNAVRAKDKNGNWWIRGTGTDGWAPRVEGGFLRDLPSEGMPYTFYKRADNEPIMEALAIIKTQVALLKDKVNKSDPSDNEMWHIDADTITYETLQYISNGYPYAQELAQAALEVYDLDFERWYA